MLIKYSQIEGNLRRTASNGLISLLNHGQMEKLALDYFGIKNEYGDIIGYQCPYSGKIYTDYNDLVLEHIIPVISKGGTVLFNCIPTSEEVNKTSEKGAKHLISWWTNSRYWDEKAPIRLEKLVNYILDGYDKVFDEYTIEEVENSYLEIETNESIIEEQDDNQYSSRKESQLLQKQSNENGIHSYLGFLLNCIQTLEKYNIDTTTIKQKLNTLQSKHIFEDIDRFQLFQNILQQIVESRIGNDNRSTLTYVLNFNKKRLMDSITSNNPEEIYNEINLRLKNIEDILKQNNLSIVEYFKSLNDITDIDIIYKNINAISQDENNIFLKNIKLGKDSKIEVFIKMLNNGNIKILKYKNEETLEGYPNISVGHFWSNNKDVIMSKLFEELRDNPEYDTARRLIDIYEMSNNIEKQIPIFINMLNVGNSEILKRGNTQTLEGYPNINLSNFWKKHREKLKYKLFVELKDNPEHNTARSLIDAYEMSNNIEKQILIFINMLNKGNIEILKTKNNQTLEGYPNIKLSYFWSTYGERIRRKMFIELKENKEYDLARKFVDEYMMSNNIEKQIPIFINMLNNGNSKILKNGNEETLEGYSSINLRSFWQVHKEKVKYKLFVELKDNPKYDTARRLVDAYEISNNIENQIPIFINMLNAGNNVILKSDNNQTLEGYPSINLSNFWQTYKEEVKYKLFVELKDNPEYDIARRIIEIFEMSNNIDKKILIFINMLNNGNIKILKYKNEETLEGYPSINLSGFWIRHHIKIKQKLFVELKDNTEYETARQTVFTYFKVSSIEEYYEKERKSKELKELKKMKKVLETAEQGLTEEATEGRKRA